MLPQDNTTAVRQGVRTGRMRRVLGVSLVLVVIALVAAWVLLRP